MAQAPVPAQSGGLVVEIAPENEQSQRTIELDTSDERQKPDPDSGLPWWYTNIIKPATETAAAVTAGALKSATNTVVNTATGLGEMVHQVPGVTRAVDAMYGQPGLSQRAFDEAHQLTGTLKPQGAAEKLGYYGEQIAEIAAPASKVNAAGRAASTKLAPKLAPVIGETAARLAPRMGVDAAASAAQAASQGGDPETAAVFGAAASPVGALATRFAKPAATKLMEGAEKRVTQALGPTKERFKALAKKVVPEMLRRGTGSGMSREAMYEMAAQNAQKLSNDIDVALQKFGTKQVKSDEVVNALEAAKDAFQDVQEMSVAEAKRRGLEKLGTLMPNGQVRVAMPYGDVEARAVTQLDRLKQVVQRMGDNPSVQRLVSLRRAWDNIVDQAGGYAQRAPGAIGQPLAEQHKAWARREGANAIRSLLSADVPDLAAINKEFSYWKTLEDILGQTLDRTKPQGPGLGARIAEVAGAVAGGAGGFHYGGSNKAMTAMASAWALGKAVEMFQKVTTSPAWRMASANSRNKLATAIMNNDVGEITTALARISAVAGADMKGGTAPQPPQPAQVPARAQGPGPGPTKVGDYQVQMVP